MQKGHLADKKDVFSDKASQNSSVKTSNNTATFISEAESLIDELMKEKPDQKIVKELMFKIGIPYSSDQIDQMSTVLAFMSDLKASKTRHRQTSNKDMSL